VAKAVATECGLPFFSVKGPELLGSYVGESEAAVRAIFQSARDAAAKNAPIAASILFFDELDSLAPRRGGVGDGGGVMERVLATLFAELDGNDYNDYGRVFCMGATNRPDLLDPSLLRPGRLDRLVYLGVPTDKEERARILAAQIRKLRLKSNDPLELAMRVVSELPPRLTGADLSAVASGALSHAVQRLCRKADEELQKVSVENKGISMEQVLEGWHIEQRTPTVELEDLLEASKEVSPTLSQSELERYERLRQQYSSLDDSSIS
jgi:peroxin-6